MTLRPVLIALVLVLAVPGVASASSATQIIVKRDPGLTAAERADIRADAGVRLVETLPVPQTEVVAAKPGEVQDTVAALERDPDVRWAIAEPTLRLTGVDTHFSEQWALESADDADVDGVEAWSLATGVAQTVAVVDSGVDLHHLDLDANIADDGTDYIDDDDEPDDTYGHGTHVSGIIAAIADNDRGIAGLAHDAKILPFRVFEDGSGPLGPILEAFDEAGSRGVRVVNASLGTDPIDVSDPDEAEAADAIAELFEDVVEDYPNTLYVVAAGNETNDNDDLPVYPCDTDAENVVCVGATDDLDEIADFSNVGEQSVDLFAPGDQILSTLNGGGYGLMDGTSMATPHVAAIAALLLEEDPTLSALRLKQALLGSTDPLADADGDSVTDGRVNANGALVWLSADADGDTVANAADNCWSDAGPQADFDGDAYGDVCDADDDGDGVADAGDDCPSVRGSAAYGGCENPQDVPPTSTPGPNAPADGDADEVADGTDACPREAAATKNGCPLAQVASLSAKAERRTATIRVRTTRLAMVRFTVERRKGRRWVRVARRTEASFRNRASLKVSRLKGGTHRVRVSISSSAGNGTSVSKTFRVR